MELDIWTHFFLHSASNEIRAMRVRQEKRVIELTSTSFLAYHISTDYHSLPHHNIFRRISTPHFKYIPAEKRVAYDGSRSNKALLLTNGATCCSRVSSSCKFSADAALSHCVFSSLMSGFKNLLSASCYAHDAQMSERTA